MRGGRRRGYAALRLGVWGDRPCTTTKGWWCIVTTFLRRTCDKCANGQQKKENTSTRVRVMKCVGLCGLFVGVLVRVMFI